MADIEEQLPEEDKAQLESNSVDEPTNHDNNVIEQEVEEVEEIAETEADTIETEVETTEPVAEEFPVQEPTVETEDHSVAHDETLDQDIEDEDDSNDDSEDDSIHEKPEEIDFSDYSGSELVAFLDKVNKENNILLWSLNVNRAKERYNTLFEDRRKAALADFLSVEGNVEMDFRYPLQMADRNWRELFRNFSIKKKAIRDAQIKERDTNLHKKNALIEQLKELNEKATDSDSFNKLKAIQEEWRNIGMVPAGYADNLYKNYRHLVDRFFDQRSLIKEFLDYDRKLNLESKLEVIEGIKEISKLNNLSEMMTGVKKLQENWKDIGPVPKENLDELMTAYREANGLITEKKNTLVAALDEVRQQNLQIKEALIEKILTLTDDEVEKTWVKKNKELAALIEAWKQVGEVPRADVERIRSGFRDAVKVFNKLKNTYFREQKREKMANLQLKVEACEKVEAMLGGENLVNRRGEVIKIQQYWKTIGPTQRQDSDEIWKRFRKACDAFFNSLKEVDNQKHEAEQENLKKKEALCEKLESMAEAGGEIDEIKPIETEYRSIGFVPFNAKKKIDKRFNDAIRAALSQSIKLDEVAPELEGYKNTLEDLLRSTNSANLLEKERMNLRKKMQKQEEDVQTLETNINFFANSKNADKLIAEIQNKIAKFKEDIALSKKKNKLINKAFEFTRS